MTNEEAALFIEAHQSDPVWREARSDGMLHALDLAIVALRSPGAGAMREAAAKVAEDGRFLHDDAPDARFGKACAAAIAQAREAEGG